MHSHWTRSSHDLPPVRQSFLFVLFDLERLSKTAVLYLSIVLVGRMYNVALDIAEPHERSAFGVIFIYKILSRHKTLHPASGIVKHLHFS